MLKWAFSSCIPADSAKLRRLIAELRDIGVGPGSTARAVVFSERVPTLKWLAEVVPAMSEDEFRDLRKSIRDNGFLREHPIMLFEGKILDGRSRYRAGLPHYETLISQGFTASNSRKAARIGLSGRQNPLFPRHLHSAVALAPTVRACT